MNERLDGVDAAMASILSELVKQKQRTTLKVFLDENNVFAFCQSPN